MRALEFVSLWIERFAMAAGIVLTAGIAGVMLAQVYFRYVVNSSLQWSEEISIWSMIWVIFLCSAALVRGWRHITVAAFVRLMPAGVQPLVFIAAKVLSLVFVGLLAYLGYKVFGLGFHSESPSLHVSTKWAKLSLAVGGALMTVMTATEIARDLVAYRRRDYDHFAQLGDGGSF